MTYIIAILLVVLSRLIYTRGNNGCRISIRFEKIVIFAAAIAMMASVFRLCRSIVTAFVQRDRGPRDMTEHDMSGMYEMIGLVVYPIGLVLYVLLILIVLPKPIRRAKNVAEQVAASDR
ncbi:MAG: hypothetical protein H7A51_13610 [Akkermansiaceae bacterium]|mgnify:CR=1 FL=1|nr:hypothetical protein [Akkermansiaceae bacterium]